MGRDILGCAIFLLLGVGASARAIDPMFRSLQQTTVGRSHWHNFEDLSFLYPNVDLDSLYKSPQYTRDAGYFTLKRPSIKVNSASDESIFKVKLYSNGIISLNDGNVTFCHPHTYRLRAPSFLPIRTDAELDMALHYDWDLLSIAPKASAAKRKLENVLRKLNHCEQHLDKDTPVVPWVITESHPERPNFSLTVSSAISDTRFQESSGEWVDAQILNVLLSDKLAYVNESDITGSFDIVFTMNPEPRIRFVSAPVTGTPYKPYGHTPDYPQIISNAGNPVREMMRAEKAIKIISHTVEAQAAKALESLANGAKNENPKPSSKKEQFHDELAKIKEQRLKDAEEKRKLEDQEWLTHSPHDQQPNANSSTPTTLKTTTRIIITFIPTSSLQKAKEVSKSVGSTITKITETNPILHIKDYCFGNSRQYCKDKAPPRPGPVVFVLWTFFWVIWIFCMGFSLSWIVRAIYCKFNGNEGYQRISRDERTIIVRDEEGGIVVFSPDYFTASPEDRSFKKPLLSAISEKDEEE